MGIIKGVLFFLLFIGPIVGLIWLALAYQKRLYKRAWTNLLNLFSLHNIAIRGNLPQNFPNYIQLNGALDKNTISIYTKVVGSGKNRYVVTNLDIITPESESLPKFMVYRENFFTKVGEFLGAKDVKTGHTLFDKTYRLKTDNEPLTQLIFDTELVESFIKHANFFGGSISGQGNKLSYAVTGVPGQKTTFNQFSVALELCLAIVKTRTNNVPHSPVG